MLEPPTTATQATPDPQRSAHLKLERSVSGKTGWSISVTMPEWSEAFAALQAADAAMAEAYGPEAQS